MKRVENGWPLQHMSFRRMRRRRRLSSEHRSERSEPSSVQRAWRARQTNLDSPGCPTPGKSVLRARPF